MYKLYAIFCIENLLRAIRAMGANDLVTSANKA